MNIPTIINKNIGYVLLMGFEEDKPKQNLTKRDPNGSRKIKETFAGIDELSNPYSYWKVTRKNK